MTRLSLMSVLCLSGATTSYSLSQMSSSAVSGCLSEDTSLALTVHDMPMYLSYHAVMSTYDSERQQLLCCSPCKLPLSTKIVSGGLPVPIRGRVSLSPIPYGEYGDHRDGPCAKLKCNRETPYFNGEAPSLQPRNTLSGLDLAVQAPLQIVQCQGRLRNRGAWDAGVRLIIDSELTLGHAQIVCLILQPRNTLVASQAGRSRYFHLLRATGAFYDMGMRGSKAEVQPRNTYACSREADRHN